MEFERVVPPSGNMQVAGRQFRAGPHRAGITITFWADTEVIHLMTAGSRIKSVRSHLAPTDLARLAADGARPARPPPLPPAEPGSAIEVERVASSIGHISLGGRQLLAAEALAGRLLGIRIEQNTLTYFDPRSRELLRARPNPLTWDQAQRLRGARRAGPPPAPATSPVTVQRRASNSGVIMVAGAEDRPGPYPRPQAGLRPRQPRHDHHRDRGRRHPDRPPDYRPAGPQPASPAVPQDRQCFLGHLERTCWDRSVNHQVGLDPATFDTFGAFDSYLR